MTGDHSDINVCQRRQAPNIFIAVILEGIHMSTDMYNHAGYSYWSQSHQQRYCFDVGVDGSCRSDSVTGWIYVEGLIGKLHSLALLELWSEMLEQTTTNCWPKPVAEGVVEDDWNFGSERLKTWACCWVFKEKVDSWDSPKRKTTMPNKTHKRNTFPLLRKEHHCHFSFSLDMWFTTPSCSERLSQTRAFLGG